MSSLNSMWERTSRSDMNGSERHQTKAEFKLKWLQTCPQLWLGLSIYQTSHRQIPHSWGLITWDCTTVIRRWIDVSVRQNGSVKEKCWQRVWPPGLWARAAGGWRTATESCGRGPVAAGSGPGLGLRWASCKLWSAQRPGREQRAWNRGEGRMGIGSVLARLRSML